MRWSVKGFGTGWLGRAYAIFRGSQRARDDAVMTETLVPGLERRLKAELTGDVWFDRFTRVRYDTDASHYQIMPIGVVAPRTIAEAARALELARDEGVAV